MNNLQDIKRAINKLCSLGSTPQEYLYYTSQYVVDSCPSYFNKDSNGNYWLLNQYRVIIIPDTFKNNEERKNNIYIIPSPFDKPIKICYEEINNE